jgi:hypothetical protein
VARKVKQFPAERDRSAYPWDQWLDGDIWELTQGQDFRGTAVAFRASARGQARRRGGGIRARIVKEEGRPDRVYVQYQAE